jgi:hypothetical protein
MNEARDPVPVMTDTRLAGRGIQFSSYIAPDRAYVDVEACITVRFPERMRSVSFRAICFDSEAGSVSLSYRCDDAGWRSCDQKDNANIIVVDVPDDGVSAIDVRGIMRVSQTASAMTYAGFLGGVMASDSTLYPDTDAAAFRLVADPDPRLPTTPIK